MKLNNRDQTEEYAMQLCLPLMSRTAVRRKHHINSVVNDSAGYLLSFVEAFCRPLWGIAPILRTGRIYTIDIDGEKTEVCGWIRECLTQAVDENSPYNWCMRPGMDRVSYCNQMKTELAGLLVGIYYAQNVLWDPIDERARKRIADWIYEINKTAYSVVWDCNHIWFIVLCLTVLKKLGYTYKDSDFIINEAMERLDRMYVGGGFYKDGKFGRFDYYNPWAMHTYPLIWCSIADESFPDYCTRKEQYKERTEAFLDYYCHIFDNTGCHVPFGRSLAYRFAAVSIFPMAAAVGCKIDPGLARTITLKNISYFAEHAELRDGILPPGFLYDAPQTVENYTSDGGAYWCTKAFLSLLLPNEHAFWQAPERLLPIEEGEFLIHTGNKDIHMPLTGNKKSGVTLYNNTAHYLQDGHKTQWFIDMAGFYSKFAYNSRSGFGISTRDSVSADNMIVLITPDGSMESHRYGFEDLGTDESGRLLRSIHRPFANDKETLIETRILILEAGLDVRVHKVRLSQPYSVREGGFCLPLHDDTRYDSDIEHGLVMNAEGLYSAVAVADTEIQRLSVRSVQPGMNLMAPMASCPCYDTKVLEPGEYILASCFYIGNELPGRMPVLSIIDNGASVLLDGKETVISF